MAGNPPWQNPPLQEAIFEIRFPAVKDYALFVSELRIKNHNHFPEIKTLSNAGLPDSIIIGGQVRHRFIGENQDVIFQVGPNTLSINIIKYSGFDSFKNYIRQIVDPIYDSDLVEISNLKQISLRYINRFRKIQDPFVTLNITSPFTSYDMAKTKGIQINYTREENHTVFISSNVVFPVDKSDLILDINAFVTDEVSDKKWTLDSIIGWADKVHNLIYDDFESLVAKEEKERRK